MSSAEAAQSVPTTINGGLIAVSVVFPLLSFITIALRFKARNISSQPLQADDWSILVTWILAFGLSIMTWAFANITGVGHYKIDLVHGFEYSTLYVLVMAAYIQFPLAMVKISILLFYKRIFFKRPFWIAANITIPVVAVWGLLFFFLNMFQCNPIRGCWTGEGYLVFDSIAMGLAQVGSSIALDVIILCFPIPVIFGLQLKNSRKIAIASIFWLGIFCCVAASVRLYLVYATTQAVINSEGNGFSAIAIQAKNVDFMMIEANCSIVAACLPCLGPLIHGGRSTESLVRSIRSVFSLRSVSSNRNGSTQVSGQMQMPRDSSTTRSDTELKNTIHNYNGSDSNMGTITSIEGQETTKSTSTSNNIFVTHEVDIRRP